MSGNGNKTGDSANAWRAKNPDGEPGSGKGKILTEEGLFATLNITFSHGLGAACMKNTHVFIALATIGRGFFMSASSLGITEREIRL